MKYLSNGPARAERQRQALLRIARTLSGARYGAALGDAVASELRAGLGAESCRIEVVIGADAIESFEPLTIAALEQRQTIVREVDSAAGRSSVLAVPIFFAEEPLGAILVDRGNESSELSLEELDLCEITAHSIAVALQNAGQAAALTESERTRSEFLMNLSHEMRTPLHAIIGYSELAARELPEGAPTSTLQNFLGRISERSIEMCRHVDNLLRLSRLALGSERKQERRLDLRGLIDRTLESARRAVAGRPIEVSVRMEPSVGDVYTDGEKLQRVLECLLLNAVKFTERGAIQLNVTVSEECERGVAASGPSIAPWERLLRVSIRDTGIGIQEEHAARIFEEFRQLDGSMTRRFGGLGLGLAVSERLTKILGGTMHVESRPGEGSTFEVSVPVRLATA